MAGIESRLYGAEPSDSFFFPHRLAVYMVEIVHIYNLYNHDNSINMIGHS